MAILKFRMRMMPLRVLRLWQRARLNTKLVIGIVIVGLLGLAAMFVALQQVIMPNFALLEQQEINRHVDRTNAALDEFAMRVETATKDYGAWNESFDYLNAPTREFERDTFSLLALTNLDVSGMAYVRFDGSIPFSRWVDLEKQIIVQTTGRDFDRLLAAPAMLQQAKAKPSLRFYAWVGPHLVAISTAHVIRTDGTGTPAGFVVMARVLDAEQISALLSLRAQLSTDARALAIADADTEYVSVPIRGATGKPVAFTQFGVPRSISAMGLRTLLIALAAAMVVLILALFVLSFLVRQLAITPMLNVEQHMQGVAASGEADPLVLQDREDEIGSLVRSLNFMLSQLKNLREQLEIQSFRLGRTESAVGLMHNVRNGLNPLGIILGQIASAQAPTAPDSIRRAIDELRQGDADPSRQRKLVEFVAAALETYGARAVHLEDEINAGRAHLQRVIELIGDQQAVAHERVELHNCDARAVVDQNAALARYSSIGNIRFVMGEGAPHVQANRVLLSQVVGNLFGNAVESIQAAKRHRGLVEVSFEQVQTPLGPVARIKVRDNGEGFEAATGKKLFEQGFSTRDNKSGGLGLHWCANVIRMMDGELELHSDGNGLGATAVLTLPMVQGVAGSLAPAAEDRAESSPDRDSAPAPLHREIRNHR